MIRSSARICSAASALYRGRLTPRPPPAPPAPGSSASASRPDSRRGTAPTPSPPRAIYRTAASCTRLRPSLAVISDE